MSFEDICEDSPAAYEDVTNDIIEKGDSNTRLKILSFIEEEEQAISNKKEIPVRVYRKIIPMMVLYTNNGHHKMYKKARGLWSKKPDDWPEDVPFEDPNNIKSGEKPRKLSLIKMFHHLKHKVLTLESNLPVKASNETIDSNFNDNIEIQEEDYPYEIYSAEPLPRENLQWDILKRIGLKLEDIKNSDSPLPEDHHQILSKCHKLLSICFEYNKKDVLKKANEMELCLDHIHFKTGEECLKIKQWKNFVVNAVNKGDDSTNSQTSTPSAYSFQTESSMEDEVQKPTQSGTSFSDCFINMPEKKKKKH